MKYRLHIVASRWTFINIDICKLCKSVPLKAERSVLEYCTWRTLACAGVLISP